jgi:hypothetical protein
MIEIQFIVEKAAEGGLIARSIGASIFTEADDIDSLRRQIDDAVRCHFDEGNTPQRINLC